MCLINMNVFETGICKSLTMLSKWRSFVGDFLCCDAVDGVIVVDINDFVQNNLLFVATSLYDLASWFSGFL